MDLGAGTLTIANIRTMTYVLGQGNTTVEKSPKTANGKRTLPLPDPVAAALRELQATQQREQGEAAEAYESSGYVLVDELGHPFRTDKFRRETRKLMSAAEVRVVKPYNARHACLTYLLGAGVPDVIVSAWAGHADLALAKRVYTHPTTEHLQQGSDALEELFTS